MLRAAVGLCALLSALTWCARAHAHGEPPEAYAVLSHDAEGVRAVRLSHGVALRRGPTRFQFVCPSAWGDMYAAPIAALADGTMVVGATSGLMLLSQDGKVRPHPDPVAAGSTYDMVGSAHGVFSVRNTQAGSELLAVSAESARVLWRDSKSLYSLAALDDTLLLVRGFDINLEQVTLAMADGRELDRQLALVNVPIDYAFARAAGGSAFVLVMFRTVAALGTLRMNTFTRIAEGLLSVAGPLRVGETTLLAPDGQLSQLLGSEATPLAESGNVLCLSQQDGLSYACNPDGIVALRDQALGDPLFRLSWLVAPDLDALAEGSARSLCNAQWQDLRVDLMMAGTSLLDEALPDASVPLDAMVDAAIEVEAAVDASLSEPTTPVQQAVDEDAGRMADPPAARAGRGGCSVHASQGCNFAAYLYLALALSVRRRAVLRS